MNCLTLMCLLHRDKLLVFDAQTLRFIAKLLVANAVMAVVLHGFNAYLTQTLTWADFPQLIRIGKLGMLICAGIISYVVVLLSLRIQPKTLLKPNA